MTNEKNPDVGSTDATPATPATPLLRVVTPDATPEEIAAIVAVFASLGGGAAPEPKPAPQWNRPSRMARVTLPSGPGAWKASALPR